jgi:hypothetical protein
MGKGISSEDGFTSHMFKQRLEMSFRKEIAGIAPAINQYKERPKDGQAS